MSDENATTALTAARVPLTLQFAVERTAARVGAVRLFGDALIPDDAPSQARQAAPVVYGPKSLTAAGAEVASSLDSARQVQASLRPDAWGDRPTTVIAAAEQPMAAVDAQRRLAGLVVSSERGPSVPSADKVPAVRAGEVPLRGVLRGLRVAQLRPVAVDGKVG